MGRLLQRKRSWPDICCSVLVIILPFRHASTPPLLAPYWKCYNVGTYSKCLDPNGCTFHNTYEYITWVHKEGIYLHFSILHNIHMLHNITRSYIHVWRTSRTYSTCTCIVRSLEFMGKIFNIYRMKLGWIIFSFPYLVHVCVKEVVSGFWGDWAKNWASSCVGLQEERPALLCGASL
jgi:hypothetical protein